MAVLCIFRTRAITLFVESRLSPAQAAALLDITTRTLRRWSQAFAASLSESARRKGRKRHYSGDDIAMLERAKQFIADGLNLSEAAVQLPVITPDEKPSAVALTPEAQQVMARVADKLSAHEKQIARLESQTDYLTAVEEWRALPWLERRRTSKPKPPE